jgi:hypothetical protein
MTLYYNIFYVVTYQNISVIYITFDNSIARGTVALLKKLVLGSTRRDILRYSSDSRRSLIDILGYSTDLLGYSSDFFGYSSDLRYHNDFLG